MSYFISLSPGVHAPESLDVRRLFARPASLGDPLLFAPFAPRLRNPIDHDLPDLAGPLVDPEDACTRDARYSIRPITIF